MASVPPSGDLYSERLLRLIELMRELCDTDRKHQVSEQNSMTAGQALFFVGTVTLACREVITDKAALSRLLAQLQELTGGSVQQRTFRASQTVDLNVTP